MSLPPNLGFKLNSKIPNHLDLISINKLSKLVQCCCICFVCSIDLFTCDFCFCLMFQINVALSLIVE